MPFYNRIRELAALDRSLPDNGSHLLVVYGRRRVGKTELLRHYYRERPHVYFMGDQTASSLHVRDLARRIGAAWQDRFLGSTPPSQWNELLLYISQQNRPLDLILDEFPYLCESDPALPSLLQRYWDEFRLTRDTRLTLCGSSISFMEREVLSEKSPLFGRRTSQMWLKPLTLWDSQGFLEGYSKAQQLEAYACFGGIPAYLSRVDPGRGLSANILHSVLDPYAFLYEEPRLLLQQELREPRVYFSLLRAIAGGQTRLNEIAQECQLPSNTVGRYLDLLSRLHLVERRTPVNESEGSRRGLYRIFDPFLRFWFRFVFPNRSELEVGESEEVLQRKILPHLNDFVAPVFEEICQEWLGRRPARLPFRPEKIGSWWDRAHQVDVLAFDAEHVFYGECKWSERPVTVAAYQQLARNAAAIPGFEGHKKFYGLFSKSGFQGEMADSLCFDLEELLP